MFKTKKILLWAFAIFLIIGGAIYGVWSILISSSYDGPDVRVEIPFDASTEDVGDILTSQLNSFGSKVNRLWSLQNGNPSVAHGSYLVTTGESALEFSRKLLHGRQTPVRVTFNNMRTFGQLAARLGEKLEADSSAFVAAADSVFFQAGFAREEYASAVFPDTYEYYWTVAPEQVLFNLLRFRNEFWNSERLAKAEELGLTPIQVATVASIVEEETNKADERPKVARLYLNRLKRNMPLQADPTVKFAIGDFSLQRITANQLKIESPYNTYIKQGLPPGPIRIVERTTIDAVLNAPEHNYLYMCAKPDFSGYHNFASDYNRHRINAARYHAALNARGIR